MIEAGWVKAARLCMLLRYVACRVAGVLPATIGHVMSEFELDFADGGTLGALVYMGLVLGAPVAGWALTNFQSQRKILMCAAVANCFGVLSFALAPTVPMLCEWATDFILLLPSSKLSLPSQMLAGS